MNLSTQEVAKLKELQLKILQGIHQFCEEHNIRYFLIAGTLIGAIRHNGFIPWDDDIDIGMMRADYDKFIRLSHLLPEHLMVECLELNKTYPLLFGKVILKGTVLIESINKRRGGYNSGIYVDVFPIDNSYKRLNRVHHLQCLVIYFFKGVLREKVMKTWRWPLVSILSVILPLRLLTTFLNFGMQLFNRKESEYTVNHGSNYRYKRQTIPKWCYKETMLHDFEGEHFSIPIGYNEILTSIYGDYMKLPPKEQQEGHHTVDELNFGIYNQTI